MAAKQKILIVDDDNNIAELISLYLTKECFDTRIVNDGEEAMIAFDQYNPNLILLDLMLPGMDGYQVCREIRAKANVPIIMLSAKGEIFDKVLGLELGADDYMMKPFDSKELVARVKAVLRRYQPAKPEEPAAELKCVKYTDLVVNLSNYSVIYMGQAVDMPPKELELLYFLAASPNQVFTREQLLDHIWGYEYIGDTRTVDVHVKRLREKIKDHANWSLATVIGASATNSRFVTYETYPLPQTARRLSDVRSDRFSHHHNLYLPHYVRLCGKKGGCQPLPGIRPDLLQLCRELFFQDHDAGRDTDTAFHLKHLSLQ